MYHSPQYDNNGVISPILGFLSSVFLSSMFLDFAQNAITVFLFGIIGAAGGWFFNFIKKWIEKRIK